MMPAPLSIREAELRVLRSMDQVRFGFGRVRVAGRAALARPSTLATVAVVSGLFFFWLARRTRASSDSAVSNLGQAATTSALGLALAFIFRYGMRQLAKVIR